MSIALMTEVWKTKLPAGRKMVLLALCDNANDQGECFPSVSMIAEKCSMGERTVQAHITDLEKDGYVTRDIRAGRSTLYTIHFRHEKSVGKESHYVYRIDDVDTGEFYVGVRTCQGDPNKDGYMGSGWWVSNRVSNGRAIKKTIISYHLSRKDADKEEKAVIAASAANPLCMNIKKNHADTPADFAPREIRTPQNLHPTPAESAPLPPQISHPTPADFAPITINEPSIESSGNHQKKKTSFVLPSWIPVDAWEAFVEMRKVMKAKMTERAMELAVKELERLKAQGDDPRAVLERSVMNNWKGLFALPAEQKNFTTGGPARPSTFVPVNKQAAIEEQNRSAVEEWLRRSEKTVTGEVIDA